MMPRCKKSKFIVINFFLSIFVSYPLQAVTLVDSLRLKNSVDDDLKARPHFLQKTRSYPFQGRPALFYLPTWDDLAMPK